jgi:hypothetical protein
MQRDKEDSWISLFFIAGLLLVYWVYWPGLSGSFIFDDFNNLGALGARGEVDDFASLKHYLFSGFSGPTGRPVALLSFLLNDNAWPSEPESFKYTNVLIHLLNGTLLFALILTLLRFYEGQQRLSRHAKWAALLVAMFWLCHPYLVSTTLYVVQRMAQLTTLFVFCGLLAWLRGRRLLIDRPVAGYLWMTIGLGVFGLLAVCSKENGALLPVLALVCELFIVRKSVLAGPLHRGWRSIFLIAPTCLIVLYLLYVPFVNGWFEPYSGRDFTPWQRVLTEGRVLWIYLYNWFVPHVFTTGIYNDTLAVSTGFLQPVTTLVSLFGLVLLLLLAWVCRNRWALVSLAVVFFFVSQLVESTTIRLELLFEHRMYMGSGFLLLPMIYYGLRFNPSWKVFLSGAVWFAVLALFCWRGALLWGDYPAMIMVWEHKKPESPRAQLEVAKMLYEKGNQGAALRRLNIASARIPGDFVLRMSQALLQCQSGALTKESRSAVLRLSKTLNYRSAYIETMQNGLNRSNNSDCKALTPYFMWQVADNFILRIDNKESVEYHQLAYIKGVALLLARQNEAGKKVLLSAVNEGASLYGKMGIASYLSTYGFLDEALQIALSVKVDLEEGDLWRRELAESPALEDVNAFIGTVEESRDNSKYRRAGEK